MFPTIWPQHRRAKTHKNRIVSEMRPPHEHAAAIADPQPLRSFHNASATQGCIFFSRQMLATLTNSSTKLWNKYAPMPPFFWRCWIFPWHFQMFCTYLWTSFFLLKSKIGHDMTRPITQLTISLSKKPSRIRIIRSKIDYISKMFIRFWHHHLIFPGKIQPFLWSESVVSFAMVKATFFSKRSKRWRGFPPTDSILCTWLSKKSASNLFTYTAILDRQTRHKIVHGQTPIPHAWLYIPFYAMIFQDSLHKPIYLECSNFRQTWKTSIQWDRNHFQQRMGSCPATNGMF